MNDTTLVSMGQYSITKKWNTEIWDLMENSYVEYCEQNSILSFIDMWYHLSNLKTAVVHVFWCLY